MYKQNLGEVPIQRNQKNRRSRNSSIFQIVENSDGQEDDDLPRFNMDFASSRMKRKSSIGFSSLHSLSRKSEILTQNNKQK